MKRQACCVEWIDPTVYTDWTDSSEIDYNMDTLYSLGFLIKENDKYLVLSLSLDLSEDLERINCAKIIPKSLIKKLRRYTVHLVE